MTSAEALGFGPEERVVVVHVDDLGMSSAATAGALRALADAATCGSVMVPCRGFAEVARIARARPELDLGVHLTLNCEYRHYRWRPLCPNVPSLCAPDGALLHTAEDTARRAHPGEVRRELRAQIDRALDAGIDVTHLDAHMGTAMLPEFVEIYLDLVEDYALPVFLPRVSRELLVAFGLEPLWEHYRALMERAEQLGLLLFEHFSLDPMCFAPGTGFEHNRSRLEALVPGLNYLILHCSERGSELAAYAPDWQQRAEECEIYSDGRMSAVLKQLGVRTIGMRALRDALRSARPR